MLTLIQYLPHLLIGPTLFISVFELLLEFGGICLMETNLLDFLLSLCFCQTILLLQGTIVLFMFNCCDITSLIVTACFHMKGSFLVPHQWGGVTLKFGNINQVTEGSNIHHKGHYSLARKNFF